MPFYVQTASGSGGLKQAIVDIDTVGGLVALANLTALTSGVQLVPGNLLSLEDQSFESPGTGTWRVTSGSGAVTWVSSLTNDGNGAIQVTVSAANTTIAPSHPTYPVTPNHSYTFTSYVYPLTGSDTVTAALQWWSSSNVLVSTSTVSSLAISTGRFNLVSTTATAPSTAAYVVPVLTFLTATFTYVVDTAVITDQGGSGGGGSGSVPLVIGNILSLQDQSFENAGTGTWAIDTGGGGSGSVLRINSPTHDGTGALQVVTSATSTPVATSPANPVYAVVANHAYTATGYCQSVTAQDGVMLSLQWWDTNKAFISNSFGTVTTCPLGTWTQLTWSATAPSNAAYCIVFYTFTTTGNRYIIDTVSVVDTTPAAGSTLNSAPKMLTDMNANHDGYIAGTGAVQGIPESYSWGTHPTVIQVSTPSGYAAATYWGQVFLHVGTALPPVSDVRIEIKHVEFYGYQGNGIGNGAWVRYMADIQPSLNYFTPNPFNFVSVADSATEADGGVSASLPNSGYLIHFYGFNRTSVASNLVGVFTTCQVRLIGPNAATYSGNTFLLNMGADWWQTTTSGTNAGVGEGRFRWLTTNWQAINFYTGGVYGPAAYPPAWTEAQIQSFLPPLDGMGLP